ncbi:MAG TPA: hypothetical protein VMC86_11660 [Gemmatimonadales bacterium]|nr:hypothetical protein [Gemmatimonadales bacterium]
MVEECVNIGPRERRRRLAFGLVFGLAGLAGTAALLSHGAPRPYRALLFVPFWVSAIGCFQYLDKT